MGSERGARAPWAWPGDAKIALVVGVPFEAFNFRSQFGFVPQPGKPDRFSLSFGDYGWKVGIWRILELLDAFGLKATVGVNGLSAERHPAIVERLASEGHEISAHGWANDVFLSTMTPDQEREEIRRCTQVLNDAGGSRPIGWTSPGMASTEQTLELLSEAGYRWFGDDASADLPFVETLPGGPMVVLPRQSFATTDLTSWLLPNNPPESLWSGFKDTFDELYAEGEAGNPSWMELTLHAHVGGRATVIPTARRCLAYAKEHGGVHYTRKADIADWALRRLSV
jgi:peptidoglycan/xylan/chitin deacetylase (PgdA/CDA1 family)